jgi:hypothetical protein
MNRPNDTWRLDELARYALDGLDKIRQLGRRTSVETWRVGHALSIVQQKTKPKRQWGQWLAKHEISRTIAWEAIRLFEAATEDEVAELTISEAKIRYGIYPEFMLDEDDEEPTRTREKDEDVERQVNLLYRRLRGAAEVVSSLEWERELLYSVEVDEMLQFCRQVVRTITQQRKTVPQPKRENTRPYLAYLKSL